MLGLGGVLTYISGIFNPSNSNTELNLNMSDPTHIELFEDIQDISKMVHKAHVLDIQLYLERNLGTLFGSLVENLNTLKPDSVDENTPLQKAFSSLLTKASKYLKYEMFLSAEDLTTLLLTPIKDLSDEMKANPINAFILNNQKLPPEEFSIKYFNSVLDYLVGKYGEEFDSVESLNPRKLLRINFVIKCSENLLYLRENNLSVVIDFLNKVILDVLDIHSNRHLYTEH